MQIAALGNELPSDERALAWIIVRVTQAATRELGNPAGLTKYVALAKAVQD